MAVANEIPVDAARRRRRRVAIVLAFASALLGSAFVADTLLKGEDGEDIAWTTDTIFPKLTQNPFKPRGVTAPISKRVVHGGQGGPEDPGPYIEESADGWLLENGHLPIDGFARTAGTPPTHTPVPNSGFGFVPIGGPGSEGGGAPGGGMTFSCPKDAAALEALAGKKICDETAPSSTPGEGGTQPGGGPVVANPADVAPIVGGEPLNPNGDGGDTIPPPGNLVSVVPEPQNWAMMIAGFFLSGMAIRNGKARRMRQAVATVR